MNYQPSQNSRLKDIRAIVFDFDGTLASLEIDFSAMKERILGLAEEYGLSPEDLANRYALEAIETAVELLSGQDPAVSRAFEVRARGLVENLELEAAGRGLVFPGIKTALIRLRQAGLGLGVITRNFGPAVRLVFPDLTDYVTVFLPRETVARVKPDPGHLAAALSGLGVNPESALMVGDHPIDILTGRQGGVMTVGVASGRISRKELSASGADLTFNDVSELSEAIFHTQTAANKVTTL